MVFCASVAHVLGVIYCRVQIPMLCSCRLVYRPSCCPIMDSHVVLLNHCILWLWLYFPVPFSSNSSSLPPATSALPLHQAVRLWLPSFHTSLPGPLSILKTTQKCHWCLQLPCTSFPDICLVHTVTCPDATCATALSPMDAFSSPSL